ncbi:MAG: DUF2461 domain-containing protein [Kiritimatiellae bacterium]|nr:DUF2461 domain-containing protein [Kiritimatiellia bacterium]
MIDSAVFHFLEQLKANNTRGWFIQHKAEYRAARAAVVETIDHVIAGLARFDPPIVEQDPEDCLFRINRDVRFSRDKSPYKTHFGAFITDRGRKVDRAGYYLHVEPGTSMLAGGLYLPPALPLRAVRRAILCDGRTLRRIVSRPKFVELFGATLPGRRLKTAPRDIPRDHPDLDLLRLTSFEIVLPLKDARLRKKDFVEHAVGVFEAMHDYIAWLNRALDTFAADPRA